MPPAKMDEGPGKGEGTTPSCERELGWCPHWHRRLLGLSVGPDSSAWSPDAVCGVWSLALEPSGVTVACLWMR